MNEEEKLKGYQVSATEAVLNEIVQEPRAEGAEVVDLVSRQQRRAAERAAEKESQGLVSISKAQFEKLSRARIMLAALVRREGRVRITKRELGLAPGARLDVKVSESGDLMVSFLEG